jgi:inosose dehydratase
MNAAPEAAKIALNPLPWIMGPDSFDLSTKTVQQAVRGAAQAGFTAVHADVPTEMGASTYRAMLEDHGLRPAPGYFAGHFDDPRLVGLEVELAKRHAEVQLALGLSEVFVASHLVPERIARPATGAEFNQDRLEQLIEAISTVAEAISSAGLRPCFHPHVGSWIETEHEVRSLLDATDDNILSFGPDTGHLYWAGMDPATMIADYADRVGAVHLKDVHRSAAAESRRLNDDYWQATYERHVWTEPGSGDIDLRRVVDALAEKFDGWFVIEVDVPDRKTKEDSSAQSASWAAAALHR